MIAALFDTETTGLIKNSAVPLDKQPQVIEFYGCLVDTDKEGEVLGELEFLCNPGTPLPAIITKITGIKDEDLKDAKPFSAYKDAVVEFFAKANAAVAHNLSYDRSLIGFEMARCQSILLMPERQICTVEATEHLKGHRLSLGALYELLFSEAFPDAHRAKNDVMALKRCFLELIKREVI